MPALLTARIRTPLEAKETRDTHAASNSRREIAAPMRFEEMPEKESARGKA
jgi:hypothetical protein